MSGIDNSGHGSTSAAGRGWRPARLLPLLALILFTAAWAQPMAAIRFVHLSPDAPSMDVVVDHQLFLRDAIYSQVTPYRSLPAGQHEISVYPHRLPDAPEGENGEPRTLEPITMLVDLADGMYYTLSVSGYFQPPGSEMNTGSLALSVEPASASVNVSGPRGFDRSFEGEAVLEELEPGVYSISVEEEEFAPATFEMTVRAGETTTTSITLQREGEGVAEGEPVVRAEGAGSSWKPIELHAFRDVLDEAPPPGGSRVRLVHLSPTTLPVDLLAVPADGGGEPVVVTSDLAFPNGSSYTRIPGQEYSLQLRLSGVDAILTETPDLTLAPGGSYTFFLVREPEDNFLRLIPAVDSLLSVRP